MKSRIKISAVILLAVGIGAAFGFAVDGIFDNLTAYSINNVGKVDQFAGATADAKITACFAAYDVCDATGFATSTQTIAAPVSWGTTKPQMLIGSLATTFVPGSNLTMWKPGPQAYGININSNTTSITGYSNPAWLVTASNPSLYAVPLQLLNINVVGGVYSASGGTGIPAATSACIELNGTNQTSSAVYGAIISNFNCTGEYFGFELYASAGGFINGNVWDKWTDTYSAIAISLKTDTTSGSQIAGDTLSGFVYEAGPAPQTGIQLTCGAGSACISSLTFNGLNIWDVSASGYAINNTTTGNAGTVFQGYWAGPTHDADPGGAGGSNTYLNGSTFSVNSITGNSSSFATVEGSNYYNNVNSDVLIPYTATTWVGAYSGGPVLAPGVAGQGGWVKTGTSTSDNQGIVITTGICSTPATAGSTCGPIGPYAWPHAFADTNYAISCTSAIATSSSGAPSLNIYWTGKSTTGFELYLQNGQGSGAVVTTTSEIDCNGSHN